MDTARQLYNRYGLANVSQRQIAEQLGISPGNLTYHFKKKEDLNLAIYEALVGDFNALFQQLDIDNQSTQFFAKFIDGMYEVMQQYRFIFVDIIFLMRTHPTIANHYRDLLVLRKQQFNVIIITLIKKGYWRPAPFPDYYDTVFQQLQLVTDFYCSAQELNSFLKEGQDKTHFRRLIQQTIEPHLTVSGKSSLGMSL